MFLPLVAESSGTPKPVPFGFALYGVPHERHHELMSSGCLIQNWYTTECCMPFNLFMPTLRSTDYVVPIDVVRRLAEQYPGKTWCLFNEPDMPTQDRISPQNALLQYRIWKDAIGNNGRIAGYGVGVQKNYSGWRNWLDEWLHIGGPLPDVWHMHIYANDTVIWNNLYEEWQAWNIEHNNLPTIISEAGGDLNKEGNTDGWLSIYHHLRQWVDSRVESVFLFTNKPEWYIG